MSKDTVTVYVSTLTRNYKVGIGCCAYRNEYKTFAGAVKAARKVAAERGLEFVTTVDPMVEFLANDKKTKIVTNLQSGKLVRIGVNTPLCCDPSSETYWSM